MKILGYAMTRSVKIVVLRSLLAPSSVTAAFLSEYCDLMTPITFKNCDEELIKANKSGVLSFLYKVTSYTFPFGQVQRLQS
jgi:hypothetical protein